MRRLNDRWREFLAYCEESLIDFLKITIIYLLFYGATLLFSIAVAKGHEEYAGTIAAIHFWSFVAMFGLIAAISVTKFGVKLMVEILRGVATVRSEHIAWMTYLPFEEDIYTQVKLLRECSTFRVCGLRINTALQREEFREALCSVKSARILIRAKFAQPSSERESTHNRKHEDTLRILQEAVVARASGTIEVREVEETPRENILIFDDTLARVKSYDALTGSASRSPISLYHRLAHRKRLAELIAEFDDRFAVARTIVATPSASA